jgi:hypothetical protein
MASGVKLPSMMSCWTVMKMRYYRRQVLICSNIHLPQNLVHLSRQSSQRSSSQQRPYNLSAADPFVVFHSASRSPTCTAIIAILVALQATYSQNIAVGGRQLLAPMQIEVSPGVSMPFRGSEETWEAIAMNRIVKTECFGCSIQLYCVEDARW